MEFRSYDILYSTHAAIWLTEAEFNGPECEPPEPVRTAANEDAQWQDWRQTTAAQRLFGWNGQEPFDSDYYLHRLAGRRPEGPWDILALSITPAEDPNAGREPVDFGEGHNPDGYVPAFTEEWDRLGLELKYDDLQFGGTVITGDGFDELSPFFWSSVRPRACGTLRVTRCRSISSPCARCSDGSQGPVCRIR